MVRAGTIKELTAARERAFEVGLRDSAALFAEKAQAAGLSCTDLQNGNLLVHGAEGDGRVIFELALAADTQVRLFQPARANLAEAFLEALGGAETDASV